MTKGFLGTYNNILEQIMGIDWFENVGTPSYPVSRIHEHAVAVLWDELQDGLKYNKPVRVNTYSGEISDNLLAGITRISIPTGKTPVLGKIPDLALFDARDNPVRVIEIISTSRDLDKENHFRKANIDFVEVSVKNPKGLATFCWVNPPDPPRFRKPTRGVRMGRLHIKERGRKEYLVKELCESLLDCEPESRRQFFAILKALESPDSLLFPISKDNPKRDILEKPGESD